MLGDVVFLSKPTNLKYVEIQAQDQGENFWILRFDSLLTRCEDRRRGTQIAEILQRSLLFSTPSLLSRPPTYRSHLPPKNSSPGLRNRIFSLMSGFSRGTHP